MVVVDYMERTQIKINQRKRYTRAVGEGSKLAVPIVLRTHYPPGIDV